MIQAAKLYREFVEGMEKPQMSETVKMRAVESHLDRSTLPRPVGYRMLVRPIKVEAVTEGGILLTKQTVAAGELLRYVARVVDLGPECYQHPKFLGGRWCEPGDWVLIRQYAGLELEVRDVEGERVALRIVNDDEVLAVSSSPEALLVM